MIAVGEKFCPKCGGECLKYYDRVKRTVKSRRGEMREIQVRRMACEKCGAIHRELPDYICPYKLYEADVIRGVLEGLITSETLGFEDYPCEMTMKRWKATGCVFTSL